MDKITPQVNNNSIKSNKKRVYFLKYFYYIIVPSIILYFVLYFNNIKIDTILAIFAIVLALIAIYITINIAKTQEEQITKIQDIGAETNEITKKTINIAQTQDKQLSKLQDIGAETNEITKKLKTDATIQKNIKTFFPLKDTEKKYQLFFPVEYASRPLPIVNQGDFFAIHVLSSRLGSNLDIKPITKGDAIIGNLVGDAILMCAPHANPVLNKLFEYKEIKYNEVINNNMLNDWLKNELKLPCWFVEEERDGWKTRKIWVEGNEPLTSPAEPAYKAMKRNPGDRSIIIDAKDYGIFARLHKDGNHYIIIAGIHQYGTWAVASLLSYLLSDDYDKYQKIFLGEKDFIAVIWGVFDEKNYAFDIKKIGVEQDYIWTKEEDKWVSAYS